LRAKVITAGLVWTDGAAAAAALAQSAVMLAVLFAVMAATVFPLP
jgi:hypothetical protein